MLERKLVLVTGAPRSGTTAVGKILALSENTKSLYEPMNFETGDRCVGRYFERPGFGGFSEKTFDDLVERIARLDLRLRRGIFPNEPLAKKIVKFFVGGQSRQSLLLARLSRHNGTIIWKDPIAALSARRAVEQWGIPVVVTYRPPEAVAASFKRLGWGFNMPVMNGALGVAHPQARSRDLVTRAAVLWTLIYHELFDLHRQHPELVSFLPIDMVLRDPHRSYRELAEKLGLFLPEDRLAAAIAKRSAQKGSVVPSGSAHSRKRDVTQINSYWSRVLTDEELATVRTICAPLQAEIEGCGHPESTPLPETQAPTAALQGAGQA